MTADLIRVLLLADTHLGFDLPFRPRIERRRRGPDFFANFDRALQPALAGEVDLVVHGGDLFYRSRVPAALVDMALAPLVRVADAGTPVYLVPGNHERATIPLHLWTAHPNLHIFDQPRTFLQPGPKGPIALAGFPFARKIREQFPQLVRQTGHEEIEANIRLLCIHQTVEGAQVGANNFTFKGGPDVVRGQDIPPGFGAVLCGHIHRAQVLTHDLSQRPLAAPVIYPGSIERTSFAERSEDKGIMILTFGFSEGGRGMLREAQFVPLPARPMVSLVLQATEPDSRGLRGYLERKLQDLDPDSVIRVQIRGPYANEALATFSAPRLRELAPPSMNISLAVEREQR
jgi:exonuclease SbcD